MKFFAKAAYVYVDMENAPQDLQVGDEFEIVGTVRVVGIKEKLVVHVGPRSPEDPVSEPEREVDFDVTVRTTGRK